MSKQSVSHTARNTDISLDARVFVPFHSFSILNDCAVYYTRMNLLPREQFSSFALCSKCVMHKPWRDFLNPWTNSIELDCSFCRDRSLSVCRGWSFSSLKDPSHAAPSSYPHLPPVFAPKPKSVKAQGTKCVPQARCRTIISSSSRLSVCKATVVYHRTIKLMWSLSLLSFLLFVGTSKS